VPPVAQFEKEAFRDEERPKCRHSLLRHAQLRFEAPPELVTVLQDLGDPDSAAKERALLELYRRSAISSGKAAELLGMDRLEFIRYAGRLGLPFLHRYPEDLQEELQQVLQELSIKQRRAQAFPAHKYWRRQRPWRGAFRAASAGRRSQRRDA
jgi:predicted HTH domain antitoxin